MNTHSKALVAAAVVIAVSITVVVVFFSGNLSTKPARPTQGENTTIIEGGTQNSSVIASSQNQFPFSFYSRLSNGEFKDQNIFFSPWSISSAFAVLNEGARDQTAKEIRSVFGFSDDQNSQRTSYMNALHNLNQTNVNNTLSTVNALWIRNGYEISQDYVNVAQKYYGSEVSNVDFTTDSGRVMINNWVESKTNDKIKDLIPQGAIDSQSTRLVITNAVYFKGLWAVQFDKAATRDRSFNVSESKVVQVPMMTLNQHKFKYAEADGIQILQLPYQGNNTSMLILLPKAGSNELGSLEQSFNSTKLANWQNDLSNKTVDIQIPRFKLESTYALNKVLAGMGMPSAFDPNRANLSGITNKEDLFISSAMHKAYVDVNEEGTEAAAATGIVIQPTSIEIAPNFIADHPFVFLIQDKAGNILFMGKVMNPSI